MSDRRKRTGWYPAKNKPARRGWYECQYEGNSVMWSPILRYWCGKKWHVSGSLTGCGFGLLPADQWRGLAEKPE